MDAEKRPPDADLSRLDALRQQPQAHHLFQALRVIEAAHPDRPRLGRSRRPAQDPVRLGQAPELAFPRSTVSGFGPDPRTGRDRLTQQAFGLFGPHGALPLHLTEYARDRQRNNGDGALVGFADMLHHRMLSLFYRAWASAEPAPCFASAAARRRGTVSGSTMWPYSAAAAHSSTPTSDGASAGKRAPSSL